MKEGRYGRSRLTSVWLNIDDYNFCKNNNISFAQIMRDSIRELKARVQLGAEAKTDSQRISSLKDTITKMSVFLDSKGLLDIYASEENNENNTIKTTESRA